MIMCLLLMIHIGLQCNLITVQPRLYELRLTELLLIRTVLLGPTSSDNRGYTVYEDQWTGEVITFEKGFSRP